MSIVCYHGTRPVTEKKQFRTLLELERNINEDAHAILRDKRRCDRQQYAQIVENFVNANVFLQPQGMLLAASDVTGLDLMEHSEVDPAIVQAQQQDSHHDAPAPKKKRRKLALHEDHKSSCKALDISEKDRVTMSGFLEYIKECCEELNCPINKNYSTYEKEDLTNFDHKVGKEIKGSLAQLRGKNKAIVKDKEGGGSDGGGGDGGGGDTAAVDRLMDALFHRSPVLRLHEDPQQKHEGMDKDE
ncbi:hypothetical protein FN846DRAFT_902720 [Sphaerosporella brunnea]|uniref:Uncharacterized protein n=1 Tax=Sphaerosporella brunnea TaxID=1250544 RepID=A0A5J5FA15_9PEZI|nr:hypothetical protein FN846DRAFT_902720 [Sphaerosporella brunnea]